MVSVWLDPWVTHGYSRRIQQNNCLVEVLDYWLKHHPEKPTQQEVTDAQMKIETLSLIMNKIQVVLYYTPDHDMATL